MVPLNKKNCSHGYVQRDFQKKSFFFWQHCDELSVANVLSYAVNKGVDVRIFYWDTYPLPNQPCPDPRNIQDVLKTFGIPLSIDDSHKGILNHPLSSTLYISLSNRRPKQAEQESNGGLKPHQDQWVMWEKSPGPTDAA